MLPHSSSSVPSNCFQVWYESDRQLLGLRWVAFSPVQQVPSSLLALLAGCRPKQRVQRLLLDLEGMPELSASDHYWLETSYLPAIAHFPVRQVALVLTTHRQHQALLELAVHHYALDLQVFDDVSTAQEWLQQSAEPNQVPWLESPAEYAAA